MSPWRGDPVGDRWKPAPFREEGAELAAVAPLSWRVVLVEQWGALWPPDPDHKLTGENPPRLRVAMRTAEYMRGRTYPPATAADLAELERDRGPLAVLELVGRLWRYMAQGGAPAEGNEPQAFNPPPLYLWTLAAGTVDKEGGTTGRPAVELMDRLARRLWGRLAELVARLPLTAEALEARGLAEDDGLLWLDRAMVAEVRRVYGVELDTDAARERWSAWERGELDGGACALLRRWLDPEAEGPVPAAWAGELARLELAQLRAELGREMVARESLERWHAGLVPLVHASLGDALARAPRAALADLPLLPVGALQALHELNAQALGTVHGHRLVRWLIRKANEGWHLGEWGPVELWPGVWAQRETVGVGITIDGGLTGLAAALGDSSKQAPERYREVLLILGRHALSWQYGEKFGAGSMVTVEGLEPKPGAAGRGRRAELRIVVNPPLTPMVAPKLPDPYRWLVPVLPLPKLRGGKADQALARLDWAATRALVELMPEVAEHGGATLPWDRMARDEGVTRESLVWALGTWHPERWERLPGPGSRYMLAKGGDTGAARDFLLRGALRFKHGQKGGERSAAQAAELEAGTPKRRRTKKPRRES